MPQSVPSAIDLQILAEYDRRCWTATAKQNKYVRLYALLQQATRKTKQTTEASRIKQAQYRNLMARVCLVKLSCPVSAALHSLEASVGFIESRLYTHAAQALHDAITSVQVEEPKYGSVALAIAALKQPLSALPLPRPSAGSPSNTLNSCSTVYDSSHTVSLMGSNRIHLSPGLFLLPVGSNSSATVGPYHIPHTIQPLSSTSTFFRAQQSTSEPQFDASLQTFFADTQTSSNTNTNPNSGGATTAASSALASDNDPNGCSPLSQQHHHDTDSTLSTSSSFSPSDDGSTPTWRFARRFSFILLRIVSHLCCGGRLLSSSECPRLLSEALACAENILHHPATLHLPQKERSFDFTSPLLEAVLESANTQSNASIWTAPTTNFASDLPIDRCINDVRLELACALFQQWREKEEVQQLSFLSGAASASIAANVPPPMLTAASAQAELRCVASLIHQSVLDESAWPSGSGEETNGGNTAATATTTMTTNSSSAGSEIQHTTHTKATCGEGENGIDLTTTLGKINLLDDDAENQRHHSTSSTDSVNSLIVPTPSVFSVHNFRVDAALFGALVQLLAHSRDRQRWPTSRMVDFDRSQCSPPSGEMAFPSFVYCPIAVRNFVVTLSNLPSDLVHTSSSFLRQAWSMIQLASDVSRQLTEMFGVESLPNVPNSTSPMNGLNNNAYPPSPGHGGSPTGLGPASAKGNARARIARRQMRLVLRNGILNEWDACVSLYQRIRFGVTSPDGALPTLDGPTNHIASVCASLKNELQLHTEIDR